MLNARISKFFEKNTLLCDGQHGFQARADPPPPPVCCCTKQWPPHASAHTADSAERLYLAYLDVAKAYDQCWRDRPFWHSSRARHVPQRVIDLFAHMLARGRVRRAVRVGDALSAEFDVDAGVPQGAVLSPVLYNAFIDDLMHALNAHEQRFGILVGGKRVCAVLYADDIVLLAATRDELQRMLDVCAAHARRWRFAFNTKKCNTALVGMKPNEAYNTISGTSALTLRDGTGTAQPLEPVRVYRYLGLTADWNTPVHHNERWRRVVNAQRAKTMRYMGVLLTARRRCPAIAPRTLAIAYTSYIRPQFEAGAELWGPMLTARQTRAIDGVQDLYLRQCITPYNTPNSVNPIPAPFAEREFALMRPGIRIDKLALRFFHRLCTAPDGSALHTVHHTRWTQARAAAAAPATTNFGTAARQSWQYAMREVFKRNGLDAYWTGALPLPQEREKWYDRVDRAVNERWADDLNERLQKHDGVKHMTLNAKRVTAPPQYLSVATRNAKGRALLALLRCNALPIGHTAARYLAKSRSAHIPPSHVVTPPDRTVTQADVTAHGVLPGLHHTARLRTGRQARGGRARAFHERMPPATVPRLRAGSGTQTAHRTARTLDAAGHVSVRRTR